MRQEHARSSPTGGESNVVVASMDGSARERGHELHGTMNEHVVRGSGREVGRLTVRVRRAVRVPGRVRSACRGRIRLYCCESITRM